MRKSPKAIIFLVFALLAGFGAIFGVGRFLEDKRPPLPEGYIDSGLAFDGEKLRGFTLGLNGLFADWYWMQSLQYIGGKIGRSEAKLNINDLRSLDPRLLYSYLDTASSLDPRFMAVYSYGAVVLPAIDEGQAIKMIEKGITNNPGDWMLYQHLGYIHWKGKNYQKAAEAYQAGSELEGAPPFMKVMATRLVGETGSRETARQIFEQMAAEAKDEQARAAARLQLLEIDSQDEIEAIQKTLDAFKEQNSRCPSAFREIFPELAKARLPGGRDFRIDKAGNIVDPTDAPYLLKKEDCSIAVDPYKTKLPY